MIDCGNGEPLVLVPGVQGRFEWMRPTIESLSRVCRVLSFSLVGEPGSGPSGARVVFDDLLSQIDEALDAAGVTAATICGVSFGGLVALRYAARRPECVSRLILVSTPSPDWRMNARVRAYCRYPRLSVAAFGVEATTRFVREMLFTFDTWTDRWRWARRHAGTVASAPLSPIRAAQRALMADGEDFMDDCRQIHCPTLIVTGESGRDLVVPTSSTMRYQTLIAGARVAQLERTGHLGTATRPERFASVVHGFLESTAPFTAEDRRRRAGAGGGR